MKNRIRNKHTCLLILILVVLLSGCSQEVKEEEQPSLSDVSSDQLIEVDFLKMFDYDLKETLHYSGTGEYYRWDTLERLEEVKSPTEYKLYVFERNIDDMSGGYNGDLSSTFNLKVAQDEVAYYYNDGIEEVLLKKPLVVGRSWKTQRLDAIYGFINVTATLEEVTDDGNLVVSYVSNETYIEEDDLSFTQTMVFSQDEGLVKSYYGDQSLGIEQTLVKIASSPESNYISRYVNASDVLKQFYSGDEVNRYIEDGLIKAWAWREGSNDPALYNAYEVYLEGLSTDDFRNISRAVSTLKTFMAKANDDFQLIVNFINFYEWTLANSDASILSIEGTDTPDGVFTFFDYDSESNEMAVIPSSQQTSETNAAISDLLYGNGINVFVSEGYPYLRTDSGFIGQFINASSEKEQDYLDFKALQYDIFPLYSEGYLIKSAEQVADTLYGFEMIASKYPADSVFEDAEYYSDYFFSVLALPSTYDIDYKYNASGYIYDEFNNAYTYYIDQYPDSKYSRYLSNVIRLLSKHNNKYSTELNDYLIDLGYDADSSFMDDSLNQIKDFKALPISETIENPVRRNQVTVSNMTEFIEAIAPNTEILLEPGLYTIPYIDTDSKYVRIEQGIMHIRDIEGLTIKGLGDEPVDFISESYYEVMIITSSEDVVLENLRMGHMYTYCVGDVLNIQNSDQITLNKLILFGCGYNGLSVSYVDDLRLSNSVISDCQASALNLDHISNLAVNNTLMTRSGEQIIRIYEGNTLSFSNVVIKDNTKAMYESGAGNGLISLEETSMVRFDDVTIEPMTGQNILTGGGQVMDSDGNLLDF